MPDVESAVLSVPGSVRGRGGTATSFLPGLPGLSKQHLGVFLPFKFSQYQKPPQPQAPPFMKAHVEAPQFGTGPTSSGTAFTKGSWDLLDSEKFRSLKCLRLPKREEDCIRKGLQFITFQKFGFIAINTTDIGGKLYIKKFFH